jgi:hypothetical protein
MHAIVTWPVFPRCEYISASGCRHVRLSRPARNLDFHDGNRFQLGGLSCREEHCKQGMIAVSLYNM